MNPTTNETQSEDSEIDPFEFFNQLGGLSLRTDSINVQLLVMTKDFELFRATTTATIEQDLINSFLKPVADHVTTLPDHGGRIEDYDPQQAPDYPVLWTLGVDEVDNFQNLKDALSNPVDGMPVYVDESGNLDDVAALALRVQGPDDREVTVFQQLRSQGILKTSRKVGIYFKGSTFGKVDYPSTFQIGKDNHAFYLGNKIYILSSSHFEHIFDYREQKQAIAEIKLTTIETTYAALIDMEEGVNLASLLSGDRHALNKLQKLEGNISLTPTKLAQLKLEFNLDIDLDGDSGKLKIYNKKDAKALIGILNDDHLASGLTDTKYNVHSKKKVQQ